MKIVANPEDVFIGFCQLRVYFERALISRISFHMLLFNNKLSASVLTKVSHNQIHWPKEVRDHNFQYIVFGHIRFDSVF